MVPPLPPWFVDMARTASRAHRNAPITLVFMTDWSRSRVMFSTRSIGATTPALMITESSRPKVEAAVAKSSKTAGSSAMSPAMAMALAPAASIWATTEAIAS